MKILRHAVLALLPPILAGCAIVSTGTPAPLVLAYPATRTVETADTVHSTPVTNPHRWLERVDDPEVEVWIDAQDALTVGYLTGTPEQERIHQRLTAMQPRVRYSLPTGAGGRYFYRRSDAGRSHAPLYWQQGLDGEPRLLIDPASFSPDGSVPLRAVSASPDGRLIAYARGIGGTFWQDVHVREVDTGRDLPNVLRHLPYTDLAWTRDSRGFFYRRYTPADEEPGKPRPRGHALYYHRLGIPESEDLLILGGLEDTFQRPWPSVTGDGRYLGILAGGDERPKEFYYLDLEDPTRPRFDGRVVRLIEGFDARYSFLGNEGPVFFFKTDLDAPRGRIVAIDIRRPGRENWRTIIPESSDVIDTPVLASRHLFVGFMRDVQTRIQIFTSEGVPVRDVELPAPGESWQFWAEPDGDEVFYVFQSFLHPPTVYRHDLRSGRSEVFRRTEIDFDSGPYVTEQRFFTSRDGTRVPMFVTHRRDLPRDGRNLTFMIGYGGGGIPWGPTFAPHHALWLEQGGVLVLANIRGGGEYGEEWFAAGRGQHKQNTFDDFIAAAEFLIAEGYTSPEKLAIYGISRGGLLMGAVLNQRPDLFGAAIVDRGALDMIGLYPRGNTAEFGSLDDAGDFARIHGYSPYHNLQPGTCYPATLVITGDEDDAAVPAHSYKYVAALQAAQGCERPALLRLYRGTGHGSAAVTGEEWDQTAEVQIQQWADVFTFLQRVLSSR